MRTVVTGSGRGIGLEFVRQLLARGDHVVAAVRDPGSRELAALAAGAGGRLVVARCDVADSASIRELAAGLGEGAVDLLINNAGTYGGDRQRLGDLDIEGALATYRVNALAPIEVTAALLGHLRRGEGRKVIHVTSGMGSIGDNTSGGFYAYRMSKAALNMASRSLASDLGKDGIASAVVNPGWVQTDMGGSSAPTSVHDSVAGMLRAIDGMTPAQNGGFLDWRGRDWPW
jgi:NAD(P)-dependent dehydrogenase (short-subunit alcohol dehydrogenase family)